MRDASTTALVALMLGACSSVAPQRDAGGDATTHVGADAAPGVDAARATDAAGPGEAGLDAATGDDGGAADVGAQPDAAPRDAASGRDAAAVDSGRDAAAVDSGPDAGDAAFPYGPYGTYCPGPTTSGVRAGTTLRPYTNEFGPIVNGLLRLRTAGVTLAGYDIPAFISVEAASITIENCRVRGPAVLPSTGTRNLISAYSPAESNLVVQDCTLAPDVPDHDSQGLQGKSFLAQRNNVYNTVDGIDPLNDGGIILANYIHDLAWFSPDSNHSDNHSHNDGIQFEGGSSTARYNNIEGFLSPTVGDGPARPYDQANSAVIVTMTTPATTRLTISNNCIDGGQVAINVGPGSFTALGTIADNYFGDNQFYNGVTILLNAPRASLGLGITGNTYRPIDRPLRTGSRAGTTVDTGNGVHGG